MKRTPTTRLVAAREISERIGSRALRITTALMTVLVVAAVLIPTLVSSSESPTKVGLIGTRAQAQAQALAPTLALAARAAKAKMALVDVASPQSARSEIKNGTLDVALSLGPHSATAEVAQSLSPTTRALLTATIDGAHQQQVLTQAGVSAATIRALQTPVPFATVAIEPPSSQEAARDIAALAAGLLLYVAVAMYGNAVATGVAQEKTSRTAEVLLATVRPSQLLAGKVIGIGLCGLGQLTIPVIAGLITNAVVHSTQIPSTIWLLLPTILLWFALGYALFAFAFAATGATVARQEEVQFATAPFGFALVAGYLLVYALIGSPHATWIRVLSFLPPLAPSLMPARIAIGDISLWESALGVFIMLIGIYGMVRLAARIYSGALVRGGARLSWRAALRFGDTDKDD
jgi:ABC-2 type transport system permease protein